MSAVYFVSDLHLGHRTILKHTEDVRDALAEEDHVAPYPYRGGETVEEHDDWVVERLLSVNPDKRTVWYMMGDVAMSRDALPKLDEVPGRKILVAGNHDMLPTETYLRHFERVVGGFKKYGFWITHMPLHPDELRGRPNLHGHCHHGGPSLGGRAPEYFNAAIEWLQDQRPVSLDWLRENWLQGAQAALDRRAEDVVRSRDVT